MIKNLRQLRTARLRLAGFLRLRTGVAPASGVLPTIRRLRVEIREFERLRKASPRDTASRFSPVSLDRIGPFLARIRISARLTQAELARTIGCRQPDIARLERDDYTGHSVATLRAVGRALGIEMMLGVR